MSFLRKVLTLLGRQSLQLHMSRAVRLLVIPATSVVNPQEFAPTLPRLLVLTGSILFTLLVVLDEVVSSLMLEVGVSVVSFVASPSSL